MNMKTNYDEFFFLVTETTLRLDSQKEKKKEVN